jgi:hypothetical protein
VELRDDVKAAAKGGGMFAVAAALGLLAAILLSFAIVYGIVAAGLDEGWSFLIVGAVYLLLAGCARAGGEEAAQARGPAAAHDRDDEGERGGTQGQRLSSARGDRPSTAAPSSQAQVLSA